MSKVLITGGAGFIGSHLADRLKAAGHDVVGIDNFLTGNNAWEGLERGDIAEHCMVYRSSENPGAWAAFDTQDVIVHCAASYSDRLKWHRDTDTNVNGAINVAIAARLWDARVVYFQTALIYGSNPFNDLPLSLITEPARSGPLPIDWPTNPHNSYAISKYAAGQYLRHADIPLLEFRLANIYGSRNLSGPIPTFYKRLAAGERCTITGTRRDFVYIDDLVTLVTQAIHTEATGTYHVSTGRDYPIAQAYDAVQSAMDLYGIPDPDFVAPTADDAATILLDPSATKADFGWEATTDLDEGVEHAVNWYRENGVAETFTHLAVGQ